MTHPPNPVSIPRRRLRRTRPRADTAARSWAERPHVPAPPAGSSDLPDGPDHMGRRGSITPGAGSAQSWWPWDSDQFDEPAPDEATVSPNAVTRRVRLRGDSTTRPAMAWLDRVFAFLIDPRPGPSGIDLSRVSTADGGVARCCPTPTPTSPRSGTRSPSSTACPSHATADRPRLRRLTKSDPGSASTLGAVHRSAAVLAYVEVLNALCDLHRADRIALQLIYWRGLTQAQVARELALPEATIAQCVARGMRDFARHLTTNAGSQPHGVTPPAYGALNPSAVSKEPPGT